MYMIIEYNNNDDNMDHLISRKIHFSVRTVFESERVINSFNNVILLNLTPNVCEQIWSDYKFERYFFYSVRKKLYSLF